MHLICIVTDRVRSTTVRYCFHRCLSVLTCGGGGVPQPGGHLLGYPPQPGRDGRTPARGCLPGVPPPNQVGTGVPQPGGCPPGVPPLPGTGLHMEYLISGGRYASCVHAGGLSCFLKILWYQIEKLYSILTYLQNITEITISQ